MQNYETVIWATLCLALLIQGFLSRKTFILKFLFFLFLFLFFCKGISLASSKLRDRYKNELKDKIIDQPLSIDNKENVKINREDFYVDLAVVKSTVVDEELNNSDRNYLIEKRFEEQESIQLNEIIQKGDEIVYIRGVGGTGKTTLLEMFTLRWAMKSLEGI